MKQWADASRTFKQERDSLLSELRATKYVIETKDTVIARQKRERILVEMDSENYYQLFLVKDKENQTNVKLVDYWKGREKRERRIKNVWRGGAIGLAAALVYSVIK